MGKNAYLAKNNNFIIQLQINVNLVIKVVKLATARCKVTV